MLAKAIAALSTAVLVAGAAVAHEPTTPPDFDPVTTDPPLDVEHPPRLAETGFDSRGARLNAILYLAQGAGAHPAVVLLHGYPGNEKNLDLAQALRRAGIHVLAFHYRGSWGSEGDYAFAHNIEDTAAALALLRSPAAREEYGIDPERLAVVGHSVGGFTALVNAVGDEAPRCTVAIAAINLARLGVMADSGPEARSSIAAALEAGSGPLSGTSGKALVDEIVARGEAWDLVKLAGPLARRDLFLIAARRDPVVPLGANHEPLVAAIHAAGGDRLRELVLDSDHAFSGRRIALTRAVLGYLRENCGF